MTPRLHDESADARDALFNILRHGEGLVQAPPGLGKSRLTVSSAWESLNEVGQPGPAFAIVSATTRAKRDDCVEFARHAGIDFVVVEGRNEDNCDRMEQIQAVAALGHRPSQSVCRRCPHFGNDCAYWVPIMQLKSTSTPLLVFCCHEAVPALMATLNHHRKNSVKLVVFDESPHRAFLMDRRIRSVDWRLPETMPVSDHDELYERSLLILRKVARRAVVSAVWAHACQSVAELSALLGQVLLEVSVAMLGTKTTGVVRTRDLMELLESAAQLVGIDPDRLLSDEVAQGLARSLEYVATVPKFIQDPSNVVNLVPRFAPILVAALAQDWRQYQAGRQDWNTAVRIVAQDGAPAELILTEQLRLPYRPERLLILDGTGDIERTRLLFRQPAMELHKVEVTVRWKERVHVKTNASRRRFRSKERERLVNHVLSSIKFAVTQHSSTAQTKLLVVTHGSASNSSLKQELASRIAEVFPGPIVAAHYAELRGRNDFRIVDIVLTVGDNEPNLLALRDHVAALYTEDSQPLSIELEPSENGRVLKDSKLKTWRSLSTVDEIAQAAFRCRPLDRPGHCIYIHVGSRWPEEHLGPPDRIIDPHKDIERAIIVDHFREFISRTGWYAMIIGEYAGWHMTESDSSAPLFCKATRRQLGLELLQRLGVEQLSGIVKPYSARRFRDLVAPDLKALAEHRFDPCSIGILSIARLKVWGDLDALRAMFAGAWQAVQANISQSSATRPAVPIEPVPELDPAFIAAIARTVIPVRLRRLLDGLFPGSFQDATACFSGEVGGILQKLCAHISPSFTTTCATGNEASKNVLLAPFPVTPGDPTASGGTQPENETPIGPSPVDRWAILYRLAIERWRTLKVHYPNPNDIWMVELLEPMLPCLSLPESVGSVFAEMLRVRRSA